MQQILLNGRIIDGLGNPWFSGDLEVVDGKISRIGRIQPGNQVKVFDLKGAVVAPGFIDIHTHSDMAFFSDKHASGKLCQGVTIEVVGNCGLSSSPIIGEGGREFMAMNKRLLYFTDRLAKQCTSTEGYLRALEDNGMAQNVAALVGHTTLRASVMGYAIREPHSGELDTMRSLLAESLSAGAFGMSLGYSPGEQADEDELAALADVVAENNGFVASHPAQLSFKGQGNPDEASYEQLTSRIRQVLEVGKRSNVPIQISHAKAIGPVAWGRAQWILDLIDRARAQGIDVACDLYGYTTGGGGLWGLFGPEFVLESAESNDLGRELSLIVQESKLRKQALAYIEGVFRTLGGANLVRIGSFIPEDKAATTRRREVNGKTFTDLASEMGKSPAEIVLQFLQEGDLRLQCEVMTEQDVIAVMQHETAMICSDGFALSPPKIGEAREMVHPRNFGAYPRILKRYVREFGALSLTSAIHKMTGLPAARLGLRDRGRIEEGCNADLVVFDPQTVADRATFADPYQGPRGISYVFLNGGLVVKEGQYNGVLAGKVLRKNR